MLPLNSSDLFVKLERETSRIETKFTSRNRELLKLYSAVGTIGLAITAACAFDGIVNRRQGGHLGT